jgi:cytochrome P450
MTLLLSTSYAILTIAALIVTNRLYALYKNYLSARSLNIPIIICLESWQDPIWMLLGPKIRSLLSRIGLWDTNATDYTTIGWPQFDRFASHAKHGPAFALVTPFKTNIMLSDVDAAREMFKNWRAWIKNPDLYSMFNAYGKNLNSVNGDDWPRHRKVTAPAFKEANSRLVWQATLKQVDSVLGKWMAEGDITLRGLRGDTEKIAMHVLMSAAFGKEYDFDTGVEVVEPGHVVSFGEAMHTCIGALAIMLVPITFAAAKLPSVLIPAGLKRLQVAVQEVRKFLKDAVDAERNALHNGVPSRDNLISTLVRANEEEKNGKEGKQLALTDDELYGNLFIFNMAGHETTSSSLSYAIPLLAIYPDIQKWVREEVDTVFADVGTENYNEAFPLLARTLALMVIYPDI